VVGDSNGASVGVPEAVVTPLGPCFVESVVCEGSDELAGGDAPRDS